MIYAKLYREDLVNGDHSQEVGFSIIPPSQLEVMHDQATNACLREGGTAYQLFSGNTFRDAKAISLRHQVK